MLRAMSWGNLRASQNEATISSCSFLLRVLASVEVINEVMFAMIEAVRKVKNRKEEQCKDMPHDEHEEVPRERK